ncbi:MAG: inositol monophosphatase family protein, partial [Candidatus Acidiferrales bacterium]
MNKFLEVALDAAREAGAVLLVEHSRPQKISYKGEVDLVTETDKRSEAIVVGRLRREFPGHRIVAEEGSGGAAGASRYEWHVDPLDGTTNFAHGYPCFAVSIALLEDGQPLVGAVFNPVSDELFSAARGAGAFLNEKPIRVSKMEKLATSLVSTGFPTHNRAANLNIHYYWQLTLRSHGVRRDGSAALDLCSVACGR